MNHQELIKQTKNITIITGAGISVAAGLPTYRGKTGLYTNNNEAAQALTKENATNKNIDKIWNHLQFCLDPNITPTKAHRTLSTYSKTKRVTIITQNIDGLHEKAKQQTNGTETIINLHGTINKTTCLNCTTKQPRPTWNGTTPKCYKCNNKLRPDITLFGENLPNGTYQQSQDTIRKTDLLLIIGTSLDVSPANRLPEATKPETPIIFINPEPPHYHTNYLHIPEEADKGLENTNE